jgi:hypothetical protein
MDQTPTDPLASRSTRTFLYVCAVTMLRTKATSEEPLMVLIEQYQEVGLSYLGWLHKMAGQNVLGTVDFLMVTWARRIWQIFMNNFCTGGADAILPMAA